jgi:hypothetical protein
MQGIYNYVPETNRVASLYTVTAVLYLQFDLITNIVHKYGDDFLTETYHPNRTAHFSWKLQKAELK